MRLMEAEELKQMRHEEALTWQVYQADEEERTRIEEERLRREEEERIRQIEEEEQRQRELAEQRAREEELR